MENNYLSVNRVVDSRNEGDSRRYDIVYSYNNDGGNNFHWSLELFVDGEVQRLCASAHMDPKSKEMFYEAEKFVSGEILSWFMTKVEESDLIIKVQKTEVDDFTREEFVVFDYNKHKEEFLFFKAEEFDCDGDVVHEETLAEYNITMNQVTFHFRQMGVSQAEEIIKFCRNFK